MSVIKTPEELESMTTGGAVLGSILQTLLAESHPGTQLSILEERAQEMIKAAGGEASFATVKGYRWATCLCVNDEVVHGIPTPRKLKVGDILTIDIGMLRDGLHTDTASSRIIGTPETVERKRLERFLTAGERTLRKAIAAAKPGNRIWDISKVIEDGITSEGYSVVPSLVGHGVGRELHEPPQIPGLVRHNRNRTLELVPGMTIAIEVIYAEGDGDVVYSNDDGWTIATEDGSLSAVFEHTVAVTEKGPRILTAAGRSHEPATQA